jgi:hypothetical protein
MRGRSNGDNWLGNLRRWGLYRRDGGKCYGEGAGVCRIGDGFGWADESDSVIVRFLEAHIQKRKFLESAVGWVIFSRVAEYSVRTDREGAGCGGESLETVDTSDCRSGNIP